MIGAKLKSARLAAGLSIRNLAEKVGVSHSAIHKYETNLDVPGSAVLIRLCRCLNVTLGWLMRESSVNLSAASFRRRTTYGAKKQQAIVEKARDFLERYLIAEELTSPEVEGFLMPPTLNRSVTTPEEGELAANELRKYWELGSDALDSLIEFLESKGVKVVLADTDDEAFDGCSMWMNAAVPVIIVSARWTGDRQRFTAAHELGHLLLRCPTAERHSERIAHRFAGAFLLPAESVRAELGSTRSNFPVKELETLKQKYGASMQAWLRRARDLGILSESRYTLNMISFRRKGWHKIEPGLPVEAERPRRFERLVYRAFVEGIISEGKAAELLAVSITELRGSVQSVIGGTPIAQVGR